MKNIRIHPFLKHTYDEKKQHMKSTFYSDVVAHYEILYGVDDYLFDNEILVGIQFDEEDTENDIINIMNLIMGNPKVRAIVVLDAKLDRNMIDYAITSTVDYNPDFTYMREEKYRARSCYVRSPEVPVLYKHLKRHVQQAFTDRMKWNRNHIDVSTDERCYSAEANISIVFMDSTGVCTITFKHPDKLIDIEDRIIRLYYDYARHLSVSDSEHAVDPKKGITYKDHPWMTDIQKLFVDDLNKIIKYRSE